MEKFFDFNIIAIGIAVCAFGKAMTATMFKGDSERKRWLRRYILPVLLYAFGIGAMLAVYHLNGKSDYGNAVTAGFAASFFSQGIYDKYHDAGKELK